MRTRLGLVLVAGVLVACSSQATDQADATAASLTLTAAVTAAPTPTAAPVTTEPTAPAVTPAPTNPSTTTTVAPAAPTPAPTAPVTSAVREPYVSETYAGDEHWVCLPGTSDVCDETYSIATIAADGTSTNRTPELTDELKAVDCFYVYPTASEDATLQSDLVAGREVAVTAVQAGRFNELCNVYAPLYRSVTLAGLFNPALGDRAAAWELARADVEDAWRHYWANRNDGRGVILIGHSQGSMHLVSLLSSVIDDEPEQRGALVSAYILGAAISVPEGEDIGGDLQNIPLCRDTAEFGCAVSYATFRSTQPPSADAFFGRSSAADGVAGCVNPAAPEGGAAPLENAFTSAPWATSGATAPDAQFMNLPGLVTGECVAKNGFSYLEVTIQPDPADPRADDIVGDLGPQWGLHQVDMEVAGESIFLMMTAQIEAYLSAV